MRRETQHVELLRELREIKGLISSLNRKEDQEMAAIDDLQGADTSLQATVSKVLTDFAAAIAAAGTDPAKIEQVVTDMNAMATQLTSADPATPAPVTPPASS